MTFSWQDIAALVIIAVTAVYLLLRLFRIGPWKRKPLCGTCETDMIGQPEQNLVRIKSPEQCPPERSEGSP